MLPPVLAHMSSLGHKVFDNPKYDYDLNIFSIRAKPENSQPNRFDDMTGCAYLWDGEWRVHYWPSTVDPGYFHLLRPSNLKGTAVLCPAQYRGAYEIGKHRGQYEALCQVGPVKVWRDPNRDKNIDMWGEVDEGYFGINIHRASKGESEFVEKWSAGCTVLKRGADFDSLMDLCRKQIALTGFKSFTYTLMTQWW
jgi:hypothetical protein